MGSDRAWLMGLHVEVSVDRVLELVRVSLVDIRHHTEDFTLAYSLQLLLQEHIAFGVFSKV